MSKMQPTVANYFKPKKRTRDDLAKQSNSLRKQATEPEKTVKSAVGESPAVSSTTILPHIEPRKFYSPVKNQNIFKSPVKLQDISSPLKSPARSVKRLFECDSPSDAAPPRKIPAYLRFQHLAEKTPVVTQPTTPQSPSKQIVAVDQSPILPLPFKLRMLEELFKAVDSVTSILHNRKELITFSKVKSAVLKLVRRAAFKEKHLGQILAVYPGCYKLTQEKVKSSQDGHDSSKMKYEMVMTINLPENERVTATLLAERERTFHKNLLDSCLRCHKEFLESLIPPIVVPEDKQVTRWHPKFNLDGVPDVVGVILPIAPDSSNPCTAREVIAKAQHILDSANPRVKKAFQELLKKTAPEDADCRVSSPPQQDNANMKKTVGALKGISQSLIDKIRAREQQKSLRAVTITPEESKRKVMLNRLPDFVKILRNVLVAEKKVAVPMETAVERLSHSSHGSIPLSEVEEHIRLIASLIPGWVKVLSLSQGDYVKMDKNVDINDLLDRLKEINKN